MKKIIVRYIDREDNIRIAVEGDRFNEYGVNEGSLNKALLKCFRGMKEEGSTPNLVSTGIVKYCKKHKNDYHILDCFPRELQACCDCVKEEPYIVIEKEVTKCEI